MKRAISFLVGLLLIASPAAANTFTYEVPESQTARVGQSILTIWELANGNWNSTRDVLVSPSSTWDYTNSNRYLCDNEKILNKTAPCDFSQPNHSFNGSNLLPICSGPTDNYCIESLRLSSPSASSQAVFLGYAGGTTYEPIPTLGLEPASNVSLWKASGFTNSANVETYAVTVRSRQIYDLGLRRFRSISLDLSVTPYLEVNGNYQPPTLVEGKDVNGLTKVFGGAPQGCTWSDTGKCGKAADFGEGVTLELAIRASNELSGWFRGRISETNISITKFSDKANRIVISGKPVTVPRFHVYADAQNTPKNVQELFPRGVGGTGLELFEGNSVKQVFATGGQKTYDVLDGMREAVKDTAAGTSTLWSIESIPLGNQPCFAKAEGLIGVVSTNATAYDGTAPGFSNGQLTYKVAGLHYAPDGKTLNLGTYDLVMRSDVARCLYGFSSAPVSAKIQVLTENGEAVVASTVVNEKNGWLNLAAYGFTFSEKNIKVELTQFKAKSLNLPKFSGKVSKLSQAHMSSIRRAIASSEGATTISCKSYRLKGTSVATAMTRAKNACGFASATKPELTVEISTLLTNTKSLDGVVQLTFR